MTVQRTDWAEEFVARFLGLPLAIDTILLRLQPDSARWGPPKVPSEQGDRD